MSTDAKALSTAERGHSRRYELDWLRTLVVLGLIPYHAAVVFTVGPGDYVKDVRSSLAFDLAATAVAFWGMPLLFLVAGAATWFALGVRNPRHYLLERVGRLAVPFIVGVLVLVPIQLYYAQRATTGASVSYLQFYWEFLVQWAHIAQHGVFGLGFQYWGHLWFVLYLLAVSVFLLPVLLWMRKPKAEQYIGRLASFCRRPLGLFLLGMPLVVVEAALQGPIGPRPFADYNNLYSGPAGLVLYAVVFVIGYLLFSDQRFQAALVRDRRLALAQGVALLALHQFVLAVNSQQVVATPLGTLAVRSLRAYITWCLLAAILGFALNYLTMNTSALRYLNEACFPVYVLHMPILTVLGFYIVRWDMPILAEFLLLTVATACVTFAVYEGVVRRFAPMRFLFGLRVRGGAHHRWFDRATLWLQNARLRRAKTEPHSHT